MPIRRRLLLARSLVLMLALAAMPCDAPADAPVTVFAAASLKGPLDRVARAWTDAGGPPVRLAYGSSSALARQIEAGAPAELFISANTAWMDHLARSGHVETASRVDLLTNRLALVAALGADVEIAIGPGMDLARVLGDGVLAMAHPEAVPAGIYAKAALEALGAWEGVSGRIVRTRDVRAAHALVARREAPLGIVYASDARAEPGVRLIGLFPEASHGRIRYPAALIGARPNAGARAFLVFLQGAEAAGIFTEAGFGLPGDDGA